MTYRFKLFLLRVSKICFVLCRPRLWALISLRVFPAIEHLSILQFLLDSVDSVFDIGANKGQFSSVCAILSPSLPVYAFEPLPEAFFALERLSNIFPKIVCFNVAAGSVSRPLPFYVASSPDSSSLLIPTLSQNQFYSVVHSSAITVDVVKSSELLAISKSSHSHGLLKIDVQGGELEVLKGFGSLLGRFKYIYVELSCHYLYKGQALASDVISYLTSCDFVLKDVCNYDRRHSAGLIQADFLFARRPS
jgi:FkbM family methyltransferase